MVDHHGRDAVKWDKREFQAAFHGSQTSVLKKMRPEAMTCLHSLEKVSKRAPNADGKFLPLISMIQLRKVDAGGVSHSAKELFIRKMIFSPSLISSGTPLYSQFLSRQRKREKTETL